MVEYLGELNQYPSISIEDGLDENDWTDGIILIVLVIVQIVGDDLTVTNIERLHRAITEKSMNSILIKLNQVGTVTETIETVNKARSQDLALSYPTDLERQKTQPADLSVAMGMGQIKQGQHQEQIEFVNTTNYYELKKF